MKIVRIFGNQLLSFKIGDYPCEFERIFDLWNDIEYLEEFFENNKADLQSPFWNRVSVEDAVQKTLGEARILENKLIELSKQDDKTKNLETLFRPLRNSQIRVIELKQSKAKQNWLRLYALKIEPNAYIITGGAIKLTQTMQDREHTNNELVKINKCRDYLLNEGIIDLEGICEAFEL